jgi:hypothetical protein
MDSREGGMKMPNEPRFHPIYKSINKPLTIWRVERRLFFLALVMGGVAFNLFGSLLSGLVMFAALYLLARWATAAHGQILRILLNSSRFKTQYDPAKRDPITFGIARRRP